MNYLAHLLLAGNDPDTVVGNFLGDFVKGHPEGRYRDPVVSGIRMHRRLDSFTDHHPSVHRCILALPAGRRRFAGIVVDIAFDHILARDWQAADADAFRAFRHDIYQLLSAHRAELPPRAQQVSTAMQRDDWLLGYASPGGVATALAGMSRRLSRPNPLATMAADMFPRLDTIEAEFRQFWPAAKAQAIREQQRLRTMASRPPDHS